MKKILLLDFSPRKKGNSAGLTALMAEEIKKNGAEPVIYAERDYDFLSCKACGACKTKDTVFCAQKDDFTAMLPLIDECDGIVFAAPVYFGSIPGPAKCFIDRLYCFFNPMKKEPLFTPKDSKKIAVIFPCGGGAPEAYMPQAEWVGGCFKTIGVTDAKYLIQNGMNAPWNPENETCAAAAAKAKELADWICE